MQLPGIWEAYEMSFLTSLPDITYCLEVLLAVCLFGLSLEKRPHAGFALLGGIAVLLAESAWVAPWFRKLGIHVWFYLILVTIFLICYACFRITVRETIFCISCGYLTQHFASSCYLLVSQMNWLPEETAVTIWVYLGIYLTIYASFYFLFARSMTYAGHYESGRNSTILLFIGTMLVVYYLSIFTKQLAAFMHVDTNNASYRIMLGICQIYAMFASFLLLAVQKLHLNEFRAWKTLEKNRAVWEQRKMQYQLSRENMELMNRKFHDMKHQIAALSLTEDGSEQRSAYRKELQGLMHVYDAYTETGNEALDTILMEKGLYCSLHEIQWNCVADGSFLSFIDVVDLYTMLGNALDNAIESVEKAENKKDRFITVAVRQERAFALIQIRNHMEGEIHIHDGLPLTSKKDPENHGYGTQSIRAIAEKYHGTMTIAAEEGIFTITILLPIPEDTAIEASVTI